MLWSRPTLVSEGAATLLTLLAYKVVLLGLGVAASRRTHGVEDFFLGGRRLGPWVAALSACASSSSAWTLLGVSGAAYRWGLAAAWIVPACWLGFWFNWTVVAPRLREMSARTRALTVTDVIAGPIDHPGSRAIRWVATLMILAALLAYVASQFQGAGKTFAEAFGWSLPASVVIGGALVIVYTLIGGFWAVSLTDTLQGAVMAIAAILLPTAAIVEVGGLDALASEIGRVEQAGFASWSRGLSGPAGVGFVAGLFGISLGYPGQPHVLNRFMALRDAASVAVARRVALAWAFIIYLGMVVLGLCARVLAPGLIDGELAFVAMTRALFPPVVAGVMLAAVLSAIMSTADSQLLVAGSCVTHDVRPTSSSAGASLKTSRLVVLLLSASALLAALVVDATIFDSVLFAWSALGAAFGPVLVSILLNRPVGWRVRLLAMVMGFGLSVAAFVHPAARGTAWERVMPVVVAAFVVVVGRARTRGRSVV